MPLKHRLGTNAVYGVAYVCKLSTIQKGAAQEKNPARNEMDVHVQDFVANEDLLLPTLKH
jgi:hypothetical protein